MITLGPVQIVVPLIGVEDGRLWAVGVGPELQIQIIFDQDIRKRIESWKLEIACIDRVVEAVIRKPQFVGDVRRKSVELGQRGQMCVRGLSGVKGRQRRIVIDTPKPVADVAATQLVPIGDVEIRADQIVIVVEVIRCDYRNGANRNRRSINRRGGRGRGRGWKVLLQYTEVGLRNS